MSIDPAFDQIRSFPMDELLATLAFSERLPTLAITLCAARYEEAAPKLRGILERAAAGAMLDGDEALLFSASSGNRVGDFGGETRREGCG